MVNDRQPVNKIKKIATFNLDYIAKRDPLLAAEIMRVYEQSKTLLGAPELPRTDDSIRFIIPKVAQFQAI